jgi:hypothetical protein
MGVSTSSAGGVTTQVSTDFNTADYASARYNISAGVGGVAEPAADGFTLATGVTANTFSTVDWNLFRNGATAKIYSGNPIFSCHIACSGINAANGSGEAFFGLGTSANFADGTAFSYAVSHIGFKIIKISGVVTLYGTQADDSLETATAACTTVVANDELDLIIKVNGSSSVDYYWRKNGGEISSVKLTSNIPTGSENALGFAIGNKNTAFNFQVSLSSASYQR